MTERERTILDHEIQRGKAWCKKKGVVFCGIQATERDSLVLYHLPSGTTKSVTWEQITEDEKAF